MEELLATAAPGPIVTFNISGYGSSALLLTQRGISSILLPGLSYDAVVSRINRFHAAQRIAVDADAGIEERIAAQHAQLEILGWLWDNAAEPVLASLGHDGPPNGAVWPRVWWAPGGLLGLLPIHAAGHHTDRGGRRTVMDRVVSSYTPTVRSLRYARQRVGQNAILADQALIVAMSGRRQGLDDGELRMCRWR